MQTALMTSSPKSPAAFASLGPNARILKIIARDARSRHLHSEIGIPEDHDTKKNNNAYDTVFVSEDFAVAHNKSHAENHGNENLEQINRNMAQLFASGG